MGAIKSDFSSLPTDKDPARVAAFEGVAREFKARKVAFPVANTRAAVLAQLQTVAGALIKLELDEDATRPTSKTDENGQPLPDGTLLRLYEGLNDAQIADVFNAKRAGRVLVGVPYCPNAITAEDVTAAKEG